MALILLSLVTFAYLCLCFYTDLKSRFIYSFPCIPLTALWATLGIIRNLFHLRAFVILWMIHVALWFLFRRKKIWGSGDNDLFLLYGSVFLAITGLDDILFTFTAECFGMIAIMGISIVISILESKLKGQVWSINSMAAMAPGFSISLLVLMMVGVRNLI